ncbi:MAG: leucine--tRNA ligase [Acidobacteriaceae bacterium]
MYNQEIDKKWQKIWEDQGLYKTPEQPKNKKYILDMFPYPSGAGLHVGHPVGYIATDIFSRYSRLKGFDVLHPMGWDAFGLPAENYAIKNGIRPQDSTAKNINRFREQLKSIGLSYDWAREVDTSSPEYYKWTQWLFLKLYKQGLAYKKEAFVNWCPKDQTVLANEQVINGCCERCGTVVVQKLLSQWFFKITDYAEELLSGLDQLDWPDAIKQMQRNWIGKSEGARLKFFIENSKEAIEVFTTRPDTLFGATYMVLAPEHELVSKITTPEQQQTVKEYVEQARKKTELERIALDKTKSGVFIGAFAINPATEKPIPIWIADYVLSTYGTGAIMAVPAHDERDYEFAKKYDLPIVEVVMPAGEASKSETDKPLYVGEGIVVNSGEYTGLSSKEALSHIAADFGRETIQYKLRDWLVSRQRYWGAPIPIIYCEKCGMQPVPEEQLPVKLPTDVDFKPTGESPLAYSKEFHEVKCPVCNEPARRDADTMDTFVDSSWYYLRYADQKDNEQFASQEELKKWLPVDVYQGGAEHAVLHLLYSRFITKALLDMDLLPKESFLQREPFLKLRNQGLILGPDGEKMSKSRGNVINPDGVLEEYGADSFRLYEMFMGPIEDAKPWSTSGIVGTQRFLERVFRFGEKFEPGQDNPNLHKLIKKVTDDIEGAKYNTAVSSFMEFLNQNAEMSRDDYGKFLILLSPFAPHITEELWHMLGRTDSIHKQSWPSFDANLIKQTEISVVVQVMGKTRGTVTVVPGTNKDELKKMILLDPGLNKHLAGREIIKEIFIPDKLINFVLK